MALSLKDKLAGRGQKVDALSYQENTTRPVWLEGVSFPLLLARQVFTNADGSQDVLYLASSNTSSLEYATLTATYQKRWKVEEYHKSLKQNASVTKSSKWLYQRAIAQSGARFPNDPELRGLPMSWRPLRDAEWQGIEHDRLCRIKI